MKNLLKKILRFFITTICIVALIAIGFKAGCFYTVFKNNSKPTEVVADSNKKNDLKLPFEKEKRVVTVDEVKSNLIKIGELSTYADEYTYSLGKDDTRFWLEKIPVIGSTNSITITCKGIVKVGYDISDIKVRVSDDKIFISIPEAQLNDNYIIWDSMVCDEVNNILNPIEFSQYQDLINDIEQKGFNQAVEKGLYTKAEDNLKDLVNVFLSDFDDYEIVYM